MSDFVQTMKDWARMCASMQGGLAKCDNCPLFKVLCQYRPNEKVDLVSAEKIIEKWAKENPEPVYPTWYEWLNQIGVLGTAALGAGYVSDRLCTMHIPADIAQKLGL